MGVSVQFRPGLRQVVRRSAKPPVVAAALIGGVAAALIAAAPDAASTRLAPVGAAANGPLHEKTVDYLGRSFPVPYSWQVIDLTAHPTTCVRFDMHAVYLGHPGADEDCPARGVGRHTGALLIEPQQARASTAIAIALDHRIAGEIDVTAPGLTITASYSDDDRSTVVNAITAAGLPQPAAPAQSTMQSDAVTPMHDSAPVEIVRGTSQVTGLGFDTCAAPSAGQMQAWGASPYDTVGIYIGGSERACAQRNLTAGWISARAQAGWHFMPLYVGWQAAWDSLTGTAPAVLGKQSADDAAVQAGNLGIGPGALLYYDMESYDNTSAQSAAALAFESAWTSELHAKGYRSAIYSSASTGIADLVSHRGKIVEPDAVDIAHWNGVADADLGSTPPGTWQAARAHQYLGGVDVWFGGVKMNVDDDYLSINLALPPGTASPSASLSTPPGPSAPASPPASPKPTISPATSPPPGSAPAPSIHPPTPVAPVSS
jgi:glycoside hydrolase-like protein